MSALRMTAIVVSMAASLTCAVPKAAADLWKVTGLSVTPTTNIPDGSKVTVKCSYKMTLDEKDKADLQVIISDNGTTKDYVNVSNGQWQGDSRTATYAIQGGGTHAIKCAVKSIDLATLKGKVTDEKTVSVTVKANTVTPGGDWAPKGTPRVNIKDQKPGNVQVNPNPVPPPKP
jgi:hypothetical protein